MGFKIGDLVRFVDEAIEGHITSFQANGIIGVTDETGFEIPALANKLTLVHGNMRRDDDELNENAEIISTKFIEQGILLAISGDHKDGLAKLHIINETSYDLLVSISEANVNKSKGLFAEKVSKFDYVQFYAANFATVGKWPTFRIQIIRHANTLQTIQNPIVKEQRVKPIDLTNPKTLNNLLGEKVWSYELDKEEEDLGLDKLKSHFISHRPNKK